MLKLIADGKTTKEIASQLYLTNGTVRNYISVILDKLDVSNRVEAIVKFKEKGWSKIEQSVNPWRFCKSKSTVSGLKYGILISIT